MLSRQKTCLTVPQWADRTESPPGWKGVHTAHQVAQCQGQQAVRATGAFQAAQVPALCQATPTDLMGAHAAGHVLAQRPGSPGSQALVGFKHSRPRFRSPAWVTRGSALTATLRHPAPVQWLSRTVSRFQGSPRCVYKPPSRALLEGPWGGRSGGIQGLPLGGLRPVPAHDWPLCLSVE